MKKGFTLLEVLIALAVLTVSMLGIYRLSSMSIETAGYAVSKSMVTEAGYQRVLELINYPGKIFKDKSKNAEGLLINYKTESKPTILPGVDEISITAEYEGVASTYIYYEKE